MILDAVLLTIADISLDAKEKFHVAIFPDMLQRRLDDPFQIGASIYAQRSYDLCQKFYYVDRSET